MNMLRIIGKNNKVRVFQDTQEYVDTIANALQDFPSDLPSVNGLSEIQYEVGERTCYMWFDGSDIHVRALSDAELALCDLMFENLEIALTNQQLRNADYSSFQASLNKTSISLTIENTVQLSLVAPHRPATIVVMVKYNEVPMVGMPVRFGVKQATFPVRVGSVGEYTFNFPEYNTDVMLTVTI